MKVKTIYFKIITIINNFVGHKNRVDTCDLSTAVLTESPFLTFCLNGRVMSAENLP